ncbi:Os12g0277650, partial [Oryza sativa Japonica Group]
MISRARTEAVVVPSPAESLVLLATFKCNHEKAFSIGSYSSIARAMVTPSFTTLGLPYSSSTTCITSWAEGDANGVGELLDAGLERRPGFLVEGDVLGVRPHH